MARSQMDKGPKPDGGPTMGRMPTNLLDRTEEFCDRCLDVVEALEHRLSTRRVQDQLTGSATAVGANLFEADEALSRKDFCKHVGIAIKELSETRFWLRLATRRGWVPVDRLSDLLDECDQLKRILGSILSRSRQPSCPIPQSQSAI